jgi:hypothetical protein
MRAAVFDAEHCPIGEPEYGHVQTRQRNRFHAPARQFPQRANQ